MNNTSRSLIVIAGFMILVLIGVATLANQVKKLSANDTSLPLAIEPTPTIVVSPIEEEDEVLLYFIDINDNGQAGIKIGCNDSLISVAQKIDNTATPMTTAIEKLIGMKEQTVGVDFYNSLYQSDLELEKTAITADGIAEVYLTGQLRLGGACDAPRAQAQLEQTVMQFSSVREAKIYLNDQLLEDVLSSK